jgi:hypothetical protein
VSDLKASLCELGMVSGTKWMIADTPNDILPDALAAKHDTCSFAG